MRCRRGLVVCVGVLIMMGLQTMGAQSDRERRGRGAAAGPAGQAESASAKDRGGRHRRDPGGTPGAVVINPITIGRPVRTGSFEAGSPVQIGEQIVVGPSAAEPRRTIDEFGVGSPSVPGARGDRHPRRQNAQVPGYVFIPWFPVGARLMAGVPVALAPQSAEPGGADGALSFAVTPSQAELLVDGVYLGSAGSYARASAPLRLGQGTHRVEIRAAGFEAERFDVHVTAGEVLPFSGGLERVP